MPTTNNIKVYVAVQVAFNADGIMLPQVITWENGQKYAIDKVTDIRQASAMRAGGQGDRYTIMVHGKQSYLFFERSTNLSGNNIGRWFVEKKEPTPYVVGSAYMADGHDAQLYSDGTLRRNGKIIYDMGENSSGIFGRHVPASKYAEILG